MKYLVLMSVFLGSLSVIAQDLPYDCKNTKIFVDKIVKNEDIIRIIVVIQLFKGTGISS